MYPCIHFKHPVCCLFIFVGMGKIEGNIMIDVSPSNNKLLDRATRILQYLLVLHASNPDFHSRYSEGDLSALFPYCILYEAVERAFAFNINCNGFIRGLNLNRARSIADLNAVFHQGDAGVARPNGGVTISCNDQAWGGDDKFRVL